MHLNEFKINAADWVTQKEDISKTEFFQAA